MVGRGRVTPIGLKITDHSFVKTPLGYMDVSPPLRRPILARGPALIPTAHFRPFCVVALSGFPLSINEKGHSSTLPIGNIGISTAPARAVAWRSDPAVRHTSSLWPWPIGRDGQAPIRRSGHPDPSPSTDRSRHGRSPKQFRFTKRDLENLPAQSRDSAARDAEYSDTECVGLGPGRQGLDHHRVGPIRHDPADARRLLGIGTGHGP